MVAGLIGGELFEPECAAGGREGCMLRTAVPETAVHENGELRGWENEVWSAEEWRTAPPTRDFVLTEEP
jgi:hypothetical protein